MSKPSTQAAPTENTDGVEAKSDQTISRKQSLITSLGRYALMGGAAFFLLGLIEWVDLNIRFAYTFDSLSDRIIFLSYYSINVLAGLAIGLLVGMFAHVASLLNQWSARVIARGKETSLLHRLISGLWVAGFAALLLNQHPQIHHYIKGIIREAEKFPLLRNTLLNHERATSYLMVMGLIISCWVLWKLARSSGAMNRLLRTAWISILVIVLAIAYYIDSRIEIQLYEYTLHRSMYLLAVSLAIALTGTVYFSWSSAKWLKAATGKAMLIGAAIVFIASFSLTFFHFGADQNLQAQVFLRSTQAKQNFKLARWAMDFDRDGYSSVLGGGDMDDRRGDMNPGETEKIGDGVDNNFIGGDLTQKDIDDWRAEHNAFRTIADHSARRFNVVFIFIDTVRADHLSAYGYARKTSPNIDKLAAQSSVFENAFSPADRTSEAVPKFMQSSYWDGHLETWTEALTRSGYDTQLFPGRRSWERYKGWMPVVKKSQGKKLEKNIDVTIETLGSTPSDKPFCAFIYVPDPHRPYVQHEKFYFGPSTTDLYDGELAYTDYHLGRLFDWMEQTGRFEDTIVAVMSDHGESLGERGIYRHSTQLYNEQVRVPMIVYVPGLAPRRVSDYVSTIDLGSTILSAVGLEYPKEYVGVNLLPFMRGEAVTRPPIYAEQTSQEISKFVRLDQQVHPETKKYMIVTQDGYKLIYNRDFYTFELFDLKQDPYEERNLYSRLPEKAEIMKRLLGRFVDIVVVSRPWDADEGRYSRAGGIDGDQVDE